MYGFVDLHLIPKLIPSDKIGAKTKASKLNVSPEE